MPSAAHLRASFHVRMLAPDGREIDALARALGISSAAVMRHLIQEALDSRSRAETVRALRALIGPEQRRTRPYR